MRITYSAEGQAELMLDPRSCSLNHAGPQGCHSHYCNYLV